MSQQRRVPSYNPQSAYNANLAGPTAVYRLYDASGQLLYVGISKNLEQRWYDHSMKQLWWHLVADRRVSWYPTRDKALLREEEVERLEKPRFCDAARFGSGWHSIERSEEASLLKAVDDLAQRFKDAIVRGEYPPGSYMPPERKLAEIHGVSIAMVRRALSLVTDRDRLLWRQGRYRVRD